MKLTNLLIGLAMLIQCSWFALQVTSGPTYQVLLNEVEIEDTFITVKNGAKELWGLLVAILTIFILGFAILCPKLPSKP